MTEELYLMLLEKSKLFCKSIPVDYREFLHDIICEHDVNEDNHKSLFVKRKYALLDIPPVIPLEKVDSFRPITIYKWCYICDDYYPDWDFYSTTYGYYTKNVCKRCYNKQNEGRKRGAGNPESSKRSQKKSRDRLTDRYIIDLLKKNN